MSQYPGSENIVYQDWTFASNAPSNWSQLTSILNKNFGGGETQFDVNNSQSVNYSQSKNISYSYTREYFARKKPQHTVRETKSSSSGVNIQ
jgi:hypothetical protein